MSYVPRSYEDIVRDQLTILTGGTVGESMVVPPGDVLLMPQKLRDRPVRRISHLVGSTVVGVGANAKEVPYQFTAADFDLVSSTGDDNNRDSIRFRKNGRRPSPGSTLTINYYPVQTGPVPLTDLNVGSVTRTLIETISREMALSYLHLQQIYKSAFLDTAEADSLDQVVALVGVKRLPASAPVATVRFSRQQGSTGSINIPSGTAITDAKGNRYLTLGDITMEAGESTREVLAGGEGPGTKEADAGALNRLETLIAGISGVTNPQASRKLASPETDDDLRRRARGALHGAVRGTVDALTFAILSLEGVKDVVIKEAPNGVAGEILIEVAYLNQSPDVRTAVQQRIREFRPAGIRVLPVEAAGKKVNVRVELTLAGSSMPSADLKSLTDAVESRVADYLSKIPPGGSARRSKLSQAALNDPRIVDANVALIPEGQSEAADLTLEAGVVLDLVRPFSFPAPKFEKADQAPPITATVAASLPIHLAPGITEAQATDAITSAFSSHLATRKPDAPLTLDSMAAAIRDDTRFALIRKDSILTVESGQRFLQLTDGAGSYAPAANETLQKGTVDIQVREGGV